jgi:iron complex outermembrane receptor protein
MKSATPQLTPYVMTNASYGSYNTYKYDIMGGSGLLNNHFVFDARYSQTYTDGYIDRTSGHLGTYAFSASYYGKSFFIRYRNFGSYEHVGQAWNGITPDEMEKYGRKYNSLGKYVDEDGVSHYVPTTDNYWQNHNHLTFVKYINDKWKTNVTLHYTHGSGYYNDLKDSAKFYKFGLDNFTNSLGQKVKKGALMRRKSLQNDFYGGIYNLYYTDERKSFVFGASANHFDGDHWGEVKWAYNYPHLNYNNHYYDSNAKKSDYSFFVKGDYRIISVLSVFCDLQYRGVDYKITGQNDKFYTDADWNNIQQTLNVDKHWDFFNPKAGINFENNGHRAYASIAQAHREPTRNNYTDNGQFDPAPKAESLTDLEVGYSLQKKIFNVGVNFYYMHYKDQLILNGNTSDIGEALTINVPKSYRMGVELSANLNPCKWFDWSANMTISKNKIKNFKESLMTYDADWNELAPTVTEYGNSDIAFSPRVIANNRFNFNVKDFTVAVLTNYVSRQYLDNTQTKSRSLKVYSTTDLKLGYSIHPKFIKELGLGLDVYNLFNSKYENNGGCGGDVFDGTKEYWTWLFPQVGTTFMASVRMKF